MSQPTKLLEPYKLGPITLPNRLVMAPLTRNRAVAGLVPSPLAVEYYGQRASAGLLVTEASQISQQGQGYQDTPGIYSREQVAGWRKVTDRVHERGGRIFIQLWHVGRISHVSLQENNQLPVAPSAIRAKGKTFVGGAFVDISEPRALELSEIPGIVEGFRRAAANALEAGFDGVEIHGANGYLLDQFAKDGTNKRTDAYGGSIENRARLMLEVAKVVTAILNSTHHNMEDFTVTIPAALLAQQQRTQTIFTYVMVAIAAISLLVGGIGIMNIVLATVLERTREIGVRRATGARRNDIVRQFLTESVLISVGGGLLGIGFGFFLAWLIARTAEWKTIVTTASVVIAFGVSVAVGVIFGIYPAMKASRINPIDALRYE